MRTIENTHVGKSSGALMLPWGQADDDDRRKKYVASNATKMNDSVATTMTMPQKPVP